MDLPSQKKTFSPDVLFFTSILPQHSFCKSYNQQDASQSQQQTTQSRSPSWNRKSPSILWPRRFHSRDIRRGLDCGGRSRSSTKPTSPQWQLHLKRWINRLCGKLIIFLYAHTNKTKKPTNQQTCMNNECLNSKPNHTSWVSQHQGTNRFHDPTKYSLLASSNVWREHPFAPRPWRPRPSSILILFWYFWAEHHSVKEGVLHTNAILCHRFCYIRIYSVYLVYCAVVYLFLCV